MTRFQAINKTSFELVSPNKTVSKKQANQ